MLFVSNWVLMLCHLPASLGVTLRRSLYGEMQSGGVSGKKDAEGELGECDPCLEYWAACFLRAGKGGADPSASCG